MGRRGPKAGSSANYSGSLESVEWQSTFEMPPGQCALRAAGTKLRDTLRHCSECARAMSRFPKWEPSKNQPGELVTLRCHLRIPDTALQLALLAIAFCSLLRAPKNTGSGAQDGNAGWARIRGIVSAGTGLLSKTAVLCCYDLLDCESQNRHFNP